MKHFLICLFCPALWACNNGSSNSETGNPSSIPMTAGKPLHFSGPFSNGMKGDSISFDLSADGKILSNLMFHGWWRCDGSLEQQAGIGPEGSFPVREGKVDLVKSEPPGGGSTAWRFAFTASIQGNQASGTFRMNINNLGCDTYLLKYDARAVDAR